ncbi:hypothetical protein [Sinisalibacter aestuarii]|uniref:Antitoxin n=1 Tax=Sinisalibacter aestuarii TaxID=2949426 RepID=A0ABQ5LQN4_9RHOB|nr:hypothetical protein [Sinisalibacter aestuarii]GKY87301.1 hypothetical protein STA1M1_11700 [Sinisalibacter aestuarii]
MTRLLTRNICTMTELREPQKVLDRANGEPVAVLKNSKVVAYLVPEQSMALEEHRPLSRDDLDDILTRTRQRSQPVLDYLKDK